MFGYIFNEHFVYEYILTNSSSSSSFLSLKKKNSFLSIFAISVMIIISPLLFVIFMFKSWENLKEDVTSYAQHCT